MYTKRVQCQDKIVDFYFNVFTSEF